MFESINNEEMIGVVFLNVEKLKNYFFYSSSFYFHLFPLYYHTSSQKSANLIGETDSTAQFTLWSPWTATSQPLGSEVTPPPWPPSVHITNHHYHLHITLLTQPSVHCTTNTTTYYIHHTHTTTYYIQDNHPILSITWTCTMHAGSCRLN